MNAILPIILSLSCSGTLLILILIFSKPLFHNWVSRRWQYYIWLLVVARLLLPFAPEPNPMGTLFEKINLFIKQSSTPTVSEQNTRFMIPSEQPLSNHHSPISDDDVTGSVNTNKRSILQPILIPVLQNLWLAWLVTSLILLIRKITIYQRFLRYMKAGWTEVSDPSQLDLLAFIAEQIPITRPIELYTNHLISSPLLLGFFRPCIVLPTIDIPESEFTYTIRHELTHYRRHDMFYKWLLQLTICVHWFNPFIYLMGREINRSCELACDEAIISKLDRVGQKAYGDTLLHAARTGSSYHNSISSLTLHANNGMLKERLGYIMNYRKQSKLAVLLALVLTMLLGIGAVAVGAYTIHTAPTTPAKYNISSEPLTKALPILYENQIYYVFCDGADANDCPASSVTDGYIGITLVWSDRYAAYGPYDDPGTIVNAVEEQCNYLLGKKSITQETAAILKQTAAIIQSGYPQITHKKPTNDTSNSSTQNTPDQPAPTEVHKPDSSTFDLGRSSQTVPKTSDDSQSNPDTFDYSVFNRLETLTAKEADALALSYIAITGQFGHIYNLRPYMTTKGIDAAVQAYIEAGGDTGVVLAILPYMSENAARKITTDDINGNYVMQISSNGQKTLAHSGYFTAKQNQVFILTVESNIKGGNVDLYLFSPSGKEHKYTFKGRDKTKTITLSKGKWAYNCHGTFTGGKITLTGMLK